MANEELKQNLVNALSDSNKRIAYYRNKTLLIIIVLLLSSLVLSTFAVIFSLQRIYIPGQIGTTGQTGSTGQTGQAGQNGTTGQAGSVGSAGATGSFFTSGYHEETMCIRTNGQLDVFKGTHGGTGTCPVSDSEIVIIVKN
jgi:Collagen triple helix repeat (20 copies)